eukprot:TRINITY_DN723_c0_g1_i7.p1 TRINITY_DN723_c0_g1~~TRINITY_DN723_c0_g1_i7.p1  ORF type:complete len:536 (-),score=54.82 TRINITY_DN723_c0_g1_i7:21-1499(-)
MSDGVRLTQYVTRPEPCDIKRPAVLDRTPYGPTVDEFAQAYLPAGFVSVMGNQRGCWTSGGVYNFWKQDGQDAYEIMEWIVKQPWSNGEVYIVGISADANSAYADYILPNPMIKGGYTMWGSALGHETSYWGGAYRYDLISHWLLTLNTCPGAGDIEVQVRTHEAYDDWWAPLEANGPYGNHYVNVAAPGVTQAGWWDIFLQPQLESYAGGLEYGDPSIRDELYLFVIPLGHCTGDESTFNYPYFETLAPQDLSVQLFLKNYTNPIFGIVDQYNLYVFGPVPAYNGGRNVTVLGNYWTSVPDWPKATSTNYYLLSGGVLSTSKPSTSSNVTYTYDPNNTAPAIGANSLYSSSPCGPRDQSKIESRSDVVVWTSEPLKEAFAMVGQLTATITVASTAIDTDFYVSVTDVYPDTNMSVGVRYGAIRMRWRDSDNVTSMMTPGQSYQVTLDLWSTAYIWNPGHSIRVHITSSRTPEIGRAVQQECRDRSRMPSSA